MNLKTQNWSRAEKCFQQCGTSGVGSSWSEREGTQKGKLKVFYYNSLPRKMLFCSFISLFLCVFFFIMFWIEEKKLKTASKRGQSLLFSKRLIAVQCSWVFHSWTNFASRIWSGVFLTSAFCQITYFSCLA